MAGTENTKASELLHTPGGVRDIYGSACARKLEVQHSLEQVMHSYGFRNVQTPTFEYFDIFNKERGTAASNEMFKFFDRGNNTLVLRPDMTPAIARCVAKYFREETEQMRFCYTAQTFVSTGQYKGKLQEVTQVGAELFMDDSSDADAEMLALTIECLLESGLKEFQIEVGHADLFRALVEEAGFEEETIETLRDLIESKNFFGVEELLYLQEYAGIKNFMDEMKEKAKETGYVETLFNRRRYIPELKSNNYMVRQFGERAAMNTPIQGTAADIMKIAMINVYKKLIEEKLDAKIVLQVHDEMMIETSLEEADRVKEIVKNEMESAIELKVPLIAEVSEAENWYECK